MENLKAALLKARRRYIYAISRNRIDFDYLDRKNIDLGLCYWFELNYPELLVKLDRLMPSFPGAYYYRPPAMCDDPFVRLIALKKRIELIDTLLKRIEQEEDKKKLEDWVRGVIIPLSNRK